MWNILYHYLLRDIQSLRYGYLTRRASVPMIMYVLAVFGRVPEYDSRLHKRILQRLYLRKIKKSLENA